MGRHTKMRKLTEEENKKMIKKIQTVIGDKYKELTKDHEFYLHYKNVFYVKNSLAKKMSNIPQKNIVLFGTHIGRFTRSDRFFLRVGSLNVLSKYATKKVWIKWSAEMNFLYGNTVSKSHVLKTSENIGKNEIVFLYNPKDVLLGYGITSRDSQSMEKAEQH